MLYIIICIILLAADQFTKYLTTSNLAEFEGITVWEGVLNFTRFHNTGGPWSMFDSMPWIFVVATVVIFAIEIIYLKKHPISSPFAKTALTLINAGAIGNFGDRIFRGYVVDMIDVRFIDYPVFNFADCCIVIGCILMCIYILISDKSKEENSDGKINT